MNIYHLINKKKYFNTSIVCPQVLTEQDKFGWTLL